MKKKRTPEPYRGTLIGDIVNLNYRNLVDTEVEIIGKVLDISKHVGFDSKFRLEFEDSEGKRIACCASKIECNYSRMLLQLERFPHSNPLAPSRRNALRDLRVLDSSLQMEDLKKEEVRATLKARIEKEIQTYRVSKTAAKFGI